MTSFYFPTSTTMPLASHSPEVQRSVIFWMAVDGGSWAGWLPEEQSERHVSTWTDDDWSLIGAALMPYVGQLMYSVAEYPTTEFLQHLVETDPDLCDDFTDGQAYHRWYLAGGDIPQYGAQSRWPCVTALKTSRIELLDGWHRLHSYARDQHPTVPLVWPAGDCIDTSGTPLA